MPQSVEKLTLPLDPPPVWQPEHLEFMMFLTAVNNGPAVAVPMATVMLELKQPLASFAWTVTLPAAWFKRLAFAEKAPPLKLN